MKFFEVSKLSFKKVLSGVWGKPHKEKRVPREFLDTHRCDLLLDDEPSVWESVNHIGLTSARNVFGFDPDKVVRNESFDRFEL